MLYDHHYREAPAASAPAVLAQLLNDYMNLEYLPNDISGLMGDEHAVRLERIECLQVPPVQS